MELNIQFRNQQKKLQGNFTQYDQLIQAAEPLFKLQVEELTYTDDDNDTISITCTEDLQEFYSCGFTNTLVISRFSNLNSEKQMEIQEIAINTAPISTCSIGLGTNVDQTDVALNTQLIFTKESTTNTNLLLHQSNNTVEIAQKDQFCETQIVNVQDNTTGVNFEDFKLCQQSQTEQVETENQTSQTQLKSSIQSQTQQVLPTSFKFTQTIQNETSSGATQTKQIELSNTDTQTNLKCDKVVQLPQSVPKEEQKIEQIPIIRKNEFQIQDDQILKEVSQRFQKHEMPCAKCLNEIYGVKLICIECNIVLCTKCQHSNHNLVRIQNPSKTLKKTGNSQANPATRLSCKYVKNMVQTPIQTFPGEKFRWIWKLKNEGPNVWPAGCQCQNVDGSFGGETITLQETVFPQQEIDVAVLCQAPVQTGKHTSFWRMVDNQGNRFGHRFWADIQVCDDFDMQTNLYKLKDMGFNNELENQELLKKHKNNLEAVVEYNLTKKS